ncbi:hypothetical protein HH212_07165 [Massilia forsythiae]|uniref:Uncharacterized protein n=1 Tax=Massilia forsythiae TaxID=2728020 RepID=A0A7Z2ZS21_9BURK|nr:hypothetical protein [Massilia forsythiae]QJD99828.1 hypothetical protein HH212_07165 [Massilia forsythiae]
MPPIEAPPNKSKLTIISHNLLRTSSADWKEPTHLFKRIQGTALTAVIAEANRAGSTSATYSRRRSLLMFDCMLRVIDEPAKTSVLELGTKRFGELQDIFYGALASDNFNALTSASRMDFARAFYNVFKGLKEHNLQVCPASFIPNSNKSLPAELAHLFDNIALNSEEVLELQPFLLESKAGKEYNVLLAPMVPHLGLAFTRRFHNALRSIAIAKAKDAALRDFGTTFAKFVEIQSSKENTVTESKLNDPGLVHEVLVDFMTHHFMKKYSMKQGAQKSTLANLQKLWTRYSIYWSELAREAVVTVPLSGFPIGKRSLSYIPGVLHNRKKRNDDSANHGESNTNLKPDPNGETITDSVTYKLLTPVPLHLSDEATTQLIFKQINKDFETAQTWLDSHAEQMWQNYQVGLKMAGSEPYVFLSDTQLVETLDPTRNPNALIEALRYFKHQHDGYVDTTRVVTPAYPRRVARDGVSKNKIGPLLGIPNREDAMAIIGYLASADGRFSEAALATAEIYDRDNRRINAVNSGNNTLTLSVLKERAGNSGWHDVVISGRAYEHVRRWLVLTAPLRAYMRKNEIKGWQNLFIYASTPLGKPTCFDRTSNINSAFRKFAKRNSIILGALTEIVSISRIRSQKGIIAFLKNFDIKAMARELGNDEETSMRHYLPDAIWDYFAVRWIRIFQNLLIVEATRETPYMARALMFETATELDEFLKTHALQPLIQIQDEDKSLSELRVDVIEETEAQSKPKVQELMVAASHEIFVALLSVKSAVNHALESGQKVHDKALYWYEFTKRLQTHIESDAFFDRGIKKLFANAANNLCSDNYAKAIRA